ncbi:hypothetical protein CRG98_031927 [Punica granatum]|uniref:Uncharacterized protein n=1 Tax=Punica granatum TaxID=22663 RepID=A0A2I0IUG9_PUNGR|nr:hypothetical protein CRG98_031927 [Punica granatum]
MPLPFATSCHCRSPPLLPHDLHPRPPDLPPTAVLGTERPDMASLLPNFMRNGEFRPETLTSRPSLGQGSARAPKACLVLAMAGRPSDEVLEPTGEVFRDLLNFLRLGP